MVWPVTLRPESLKLGLRIPGIQDGTLANFVQPYTIETPAVMFTFPAYVPNPNWCLTGYSYKASSEVGESMIASWDDLTRTFIFDYQEGSPEPLEGDPLIEYVDYMVTIVASTGLS